MRLDILPNCEFRESELVKSFGRIWESPKVLTISATDKTPLVNLDDRKP